MIEIRAPADVFEDVEEGAEGLLEQWLVDEGERVAAGQPLADAVVVKTSFQIVAPADGTMSRILVAGGENFGPGTELATLEEVDPPERGPAREGRPATGTERSRTACRSRGFAAPWRASWPLPGGSRAWPRASTST